MVAAQGAGCCVGKLLEGRVPEQHGFGTILIAVRMRLERVLLCWSALLWLETKREGVFLYCG